MALSPSPHTLNLGAMSQSIETIYADHFQFVWRVLRRLGVQEQDASDAVQDVFLVVHRKLPEFRGDSKITTWLFSICMRVASERRRVAHLRHELAFESPLEATSPGDLTEELEQRELFAELERILDQLSLEQRAVFTLFELEGHRCEDIAELVGAPLGTVYSRLRLARAAFQKAVERRRTRQDFDIRAAGVSM